MRDNGKFQDSLLSLCVCNCVCGHTGFPALEPLANKLIIYRKKKKFLTVMKFVHFCVGMKMDNHEKQQ